jgi:hypothetical protein
MKSRSRRPALRSPVIAVRVPEPLYRQIKAEAKQAKQTMSDYMAWLLMFSLTLQRILRERLDG